MERPDQRTRTRIRFETTAILQIDDQNIAAHTSSRDISLDGIFLRTGETIPINAPCLVIITITGASSILTLRIKGRTIRRDQAGVAVRFTEFELDSFAYLKNIVLNNQVPDSLA
jgi:hypothetical protein